MSDKISKYNIEKKSRICVYKKNKNGMGGIAIDLATQEKIIIAENVENFALENDEVEVIVNKVDDGELYGIIQRIIKHNTTNLIGYIQPYKNQFLLKVSAPKFGHYLVIINSPFETFDRNELVNTVITSYPKDNQPYFEVILANSIGKDDEDVAFIEQILLEADLPVDFSLGAINQSQQLPEEILAKDLVDRVDLRELPFITIDGADAKDFDDAVYCKIADNIFHLYVAIADVAHYVKPGSALDLEAYKRGTSVYFPKMVIPMLPEKLSNGLCSLNPNVDRLVMCCEMQISIDGDILNYKIYNGVINSKSRLTYDQVQDWLNELSFTPGYLISSITNLYLTYQALLKNRTRRGAIDFDSVESMFIFDKQGLVADIQPRVRLEAHKLIEECMLATNVCVADYMLKNNHPALFRTHDRPSEEKFVALKNFLNSLAIPLDVKYENLTPSHLSELLVKIKNHTQFSTIQQAILRTMQLAIYSPQNIGHFGLSYDRYSHFTSPIRRYPDLLVHRAVKGIILGSEHSYSHSLEIMGEHLSFTERRAEDLSRKVDSFYKCQYAKSHLGSEFVGIITSIVNFGLFVYIPRLMLDGLVHVTELGKDYFIFEEKTQILIGKKSGIKFHIGQEIIVQIANVNMVKLFIDLHLVSGDLKVKLV